MALLRVSDYLQIQASRAPGVRLEVQKISSPFSLREWRTHGAVVDVSKYHDDPESIYVRTKVASPEVYLNLKSLMSSLQHELDSSWAVLGEVYGRFPPLNQLGLTLRRIRSDLDETIANLTPGDFVRARFSFESAGAELLKLLATPLYGNNPNSAVRELLQNAVDAVLEMEAITQRTGSVAPTMQQDADVVISLEGNDTDGYTLRVTDKGVGMNTHILKNYFLRAGASYRRSAEWQRDFTDGSGHSRVLRSGRFGIGVLAVFILGPKVDVKTRHYNQQYGLSFSARLETYPIDLRYCEMLVGTEIKVTVAKAHLPQLKEMFDSKMGDKLGVGSLPAGLYLVPHPSLSLQLNGKSVERGKLWPAYRQTPLPLGWNSIKPTGFEEVQWHYRPDSLRWVEVEPMTCNGIAVSPGAGGSYFRSLRKLRDGDLAVSRPKLSVFDPDGNLPLTLDRTLAAPRLPFEKELVRDIYRDVAAYCLATFVGNGAAGPQIRSNWSLDHSAFQYSSGYSFLFLENGFTVLDSKLASSQGLHALNIFRFLRDFALPRPANGEASAVLGGFAGGARAHDKIYREAIMAVHGGNDLYGYKVIGARIICSNKLWADSKIRIADWYLKQLSEEANADGCLSLTVGKCLPPSLPVTVVADAIQLDWRNASMIVVQFHVVKSNSDPAQSLISKAFYEDIGSTLIPYELSERTKLAGYHKLRRQIDFHETRLNAKAKEKA